MMIIAQYRRCRIHNHVPKGILDVSRMATHRFSFSDSKKAFDLVASYCEGVMKAMIDF